MSEVLTEEQEANARLIAAAPRLLMACEYALKRMGCGNIDVYRDAREVLSAAIAKAKGEEGK